MIPALFYSLLLGLSLANVANGVADRLRSGKIAPKDVAANWALEHLPSRHRSLLLDPRQAYLGQGMDCLALRANQLTEFVEFVKHEASCLLKSTPGA